MKAFICLALVACVAARSVDLDSYRFLKEKSLLKDELLSNKFHRFQLPKKSILGMDTLDTLSTLDRLDTLKNTWGSEVNSLDTFKNTWGHKVNTWDERRVSIYSFEEIVETSLFREYYAIPLFRQYLTQYPVIFRKYIESPLFQQFWTVPQFQQYFRNPIFFYKYIVPQVQIIAQSQEEIFNGEYNTPSYRTFDDEYLNRNLHREGREVQVGEYLNRILNRNTEYTPYVTPYTTSSTRGLYNREFYAPSSVNYKFLLDKIFKTLFVNTPVEGEVTQVRTDVKVAPAHEKVVVEPITGETKVVVQEPKIVDVKVDERVIPRTQAVSEIEREVYVKEALLKKLVLHKKISHEVYTVLKTLPLGHVKELVRKIVGDYEYVTLINEIETPFHTRDIQTPFFNRDVLETPFVTRRDNLHYGQNVHQLIKELYNNELVGDRVVPYLRELLNTHNNQKFNTFNTETIRGDVQTPLLEEIVRRQ